MNPDLQKLQPYPFEKLRALFADLTPPPGLEPVALSIGEPRHAAPGFVLEELSAQLDRLSNYPATRGLPELRGAIGRWLERRFQLPSIDDNHQVLPVNGTREALFAIAQATVRRAPEALVLCPNPFYQIYEGAALLAGATPLFLNCEAEHGFLPDFSAVTETQWQQCQLLYLCSPGNPTGAVMPLAQLQDLIERAREYDFIIASDECYSEIYRDEARPPAGLLQACAAMGDRDFHNCVVFHSLSKRSNLPGLRSGFVAGDAGVLADFLRYRTYHGCAMPLHHQLASVAAWNDEAHVRANRALYREKFDTLVPLLQDRVALQAPEAGFYLWPETPIDDTEFARQLFAREHVTVLPGRFLARDTPAGNPGVGRVRMALVAELAQCEEAVQRLLRCLENL